MIYMRFAIVISCLCCFVAKINGQNDSIKSVQLNELVVTGENIYRHEDHLVIIPTNEQKKHSQTGYALLYNLMIPGVSISENGSVSTMGINTGIYINGQPADVEDVIYLIPNDVDKVELYDFPTGKYSKDNMALNFVIKHYTYGGYVHLLGEQSLGINSGTYQASASLNKNSTTYSVFGGYGYADIKDIQTNSLEEYLLSNRQVSRETSTVQDLNSNNKYVQLRIKNQGQSRYLVGKLSVVANDIPSSQSEGNVIIDDAAAGSSGNSLSSRSISPKIDLNGEFSLDSVNTLRWGIHGKYSHSKYDRLYSESHEEYLTQGRENASSVDASIIYTHNAKRGKLMAELYNHYNVYHTRYSGYYSSTENLWKNKALAFLSYNCPFNDKFALQARVGVDWYQHRLQGFSKFNTWNPRLNLRLNRNINRGMLVWSFMLANSSTSVNVINNAEIQINPFLIRKGNPDLRKSYDIDTYAYYSLPVRKINFTTMVRYQFTKNPLIYTYELDDEVIIQSFDRKGSNQETSAIVSGTWQPNTKLSLNGGIRWTYTKIMTFENPHNTNITGSCALQWYVGNFQLSSGIDLGSTTMDKYSAIRIKSPFSYNFMVSYSHKNLIASASVNSPFGKRRIEYSMSSPYYSFCNRMLSHQNYRNCSLSLSYLFEFGRKTTYTKPDIDTEHSSSMLRES